MVTIYTDYPTQKEADKAHKERDVFSKENNYEVYNWNTCYKCMNFQVDLHHPEYGGNCKLMAVTGAYPGVMAEAVCDKFLSCKGLDINNKPVDPAQWPAWVRTKERYGKKKEFILLESDLRKYAVKDLIAIHLIRLFDLDPQKICEVINETVAREGTPVKSPEICASYGDPPPPPEWIQDFREALQRDDLVIICYQKLVSREWTFLMCSEKIID
jgi:hypothetical protein